MAFDVVHDGEAESETKERCCLCRTPTRYWHAAKDVAVCQPCAKTAKESDLPNKSEWLAKERSLSKSIFN